MTEDTKKLLTQVLALTEGERAALAATLIESLEEEEAGDIEASWELELKRRIDELDSGNGTTLSWTEVRKKILEEMG